ncbi:E3 ubiquitin-protein ligase makorin-like isoform X2 [Quercus robur]|uniref:E3 ubiquitin-protein ligase makorin-like isoform X2 n=1 Tax=Quercus robur TaxID=38942 RepID=UPI002162C26F|nr:E3 ubiquitin-protein ligase makorin-like isoform X2 [Quercus robur]
MHVKVPESFGPLIASTSILGMETAHLGVVDFIRVLCKFFAHGACLKGEHCEFSHDWKDPPHNICTYYQKGLCAYGSRCRYEHVKASRGHSSASSSSTNARQSLFSDIVPPGNSTRSVLGRKLSYFVSPSVIWYSSKEEKQDIVDSYKAKLKSIDCKHFDFGNGNCPFGSSCFYKHAYRDGRLEEVVLRHLGSEDGETVIAKNIRLSEFLGNMRIR